MTQWYAVLVGWCLGVITMAAIGFVANPPLLHQHAAWRNPDRIIAPPLTESGKVTIIAPVPQGYYNFSTVPDRDCVRDSEPPYGFTCVPGSHGVITIIRDGGEKNSSLDSKP